MVKSRFLLLCGLLLALCFTGSASQIGSFTGVGTITVSSTGTISWSLNGFGPNLLLIQSADGIYSGISPIDGILNLTDGANNSGPDIVGPPGFPNQLFITFGGLAPNLLINHISQGTDTTAQCGLAPAIGQVCTPEVSPGVAGPFDFQNLDNGVGGISSSAAFTFSGVDTAGHIWSGTFTAQFGTPFQTALANLALHGSVTTSYSVLDITVSAVPEPGPLSTMFLGLGLLAVAFGVKKYRRA